jgi:hypothetical protein
MLPACLHSASRRTALTAALGVLATALAGCQGVTGIQPAAQVRVIDASPDAPSLDFYQSSPSQFAPANLYNIGFGTVTSYIPVAAGAYTHSADLAGTQQQLAQVHGALAPGAQYTILAGNISANLQLAVLKDQSVPAPAGQISLRFIGQATRSGPVDIYLEPAGFSLAGGYPIAAGVHFGSNTGYINAPAGTYSIVAYPAGSAPTATQPDYTGSQVTYPATAARTILLLDQPAESIQPGAGPSIEQPSPTLQIVTANDYDPAG